MKNTFTYEEHIMLKTIGDRLKRERIKQKMSIYALSLKTKLHQQTIKLIEEGKTNPSILTLEILTKFLQVHILV